MKIDIYKFVKSKLVTTPKTVEMSDTFSSSLYHYYERHYDANPTGIELAKLIKVMDRKQPVKGITDLKRICKGKVIRAMIQKEDRLEIYIREKML